MYPLSFRECLVNFKAKVHLFCIIYRTDLNVIFKDLFEFLGKSQKCFNKTKINKLIIFEAGHPFKYIVNVNNL